MTDEEEFRARWRAEKEAYCDWGDFVAAKVVGLLADSIAPLSAGVFLRLPVKPRIKTEESMVQKAFYRGKAYKNPYDDIEDKVGVRFVVLTSEDAPLVERVIVDQGLAFWSAEKARDFLVERAQKPLEFGYQSVHYVLRSKLGNVSQGRHISENLPCEVQVRTLLQHAYSELTHDTIYKPKVKATAEMHRAAAKSMALIEATDDYFIHVSSLIRSATERSRAINDAVLKAYSAGLGTEPEETPLNSLLVDHFEDLVGGDFPQKFAAWLAERPYVLDRIRERQSSALYRVPAVLLVYYCASTFPAAAKVDCPLTEAELGPIYSDVGQGLHG